MEPWVIGSSRTEIEGAIGLYGEFGAILEKQLKGKRRLGQDNRMQEMKGKTYGQ